MDEAVRFHGHLGVFLVLGLKAGVYANEVLGRDCFQTRAIVETKPVPPYSCFADGVQVATGCTMGKGNIELRTRHSLLVTFMKKDERLRLCLRSDILESLGAISSMEESRRVALTLVDKPVRALFNIGE